MEKFGSVLVSCCTPNRGNKKNTGARATTFASRAPDLAGMASLDGGTFLMGGADKDGRPEDGEGPVREVELAPFRMDRTTVTNEEFAEFVEDTGYKTEAEHFGWSFVFHLLVPSKIKRKQAGSRRVQGLQWWIAVEKAYWLKPEGPGSFIKKRMHHPVVHVSWNDAAAYAQWAGKRLPTEAEWEYAARGGLVRKRYCWGDELLPGGKHMCNIWQGRFPHENSAKDGWIGTAPAKSFPANGYGMRNMAGNVWEWCADWFSPDWHVPDKEATRVDPTGPGSGDRRVMRGGVLSVPRQLLQPLPRRRPYRKYARFLDR